MTEPPLKKGGFMFSKVLLAISLSLAAATVAQAQNTSVSTTSESTTAAPATVRLMSGLKSTNDSARFVDQNNSQARTLKAKQEIYLGARHTSGWGAYGQVVQTRAAFNDSKKDRWVSEDPSVTLLHPEYYSDTVSSWSGQFRLYFPVSSSSKPLNRYQAAYYLTYKEKINFQDDFSNQLIPRAYFQNSYLATDRTFYVEDKATFSRKVNSWFKAGIGQWTQIESHNRSETGATIDVFPYADFILSKNVFIGPRVFLPLFVQGSVNEGARAARADHAFAEVYLEAKID